MKTTQIYKIVLAFTLLLSYSFCLANDVDKKIENLEYDLNTLKAAIVASERSLKRSQKLKKSKPDYSKNFLEGSNNLTDLVQSLELQLKTDFETLENNKEQKNPTQIKKIKVLRAEFSNVINK